MPPKKAPAAPSKKADVKKKEKLVEDKTFGLKNKKGAKTQKYIQNVQKAYIPPPKPNEQKTKKDEKKKEQAEINALFKPVTAAQKVEKGADPKSVLCAFYKQGQCGKGDKCKFSHDLGIERKAIKKSVYFDSRDDEDNMENWDEAKLAEVVEKKHGEKERNMPKTDIICKHFLDALENNKYGWFWECPNGGANCHYRHALPPGFVLKRDIKKEKKEEISIEELVENERSALGDNLTPVTLVTFLDWKKRKIAEKKSKAKDEMDKKAKEFKAGRHVGLSGKDMFTFNPDLITEDQMDEDEGTFDFRREDEDDDDLPVTELDLNNLAMQAREADGTGTKVEARTFEITSRANGEDPGAAAAAAATISTKDVGDIDADLFGDEEDLEELEKELEALNTND